jgi:hypothetical protein
VGGAQLRRRLTSQGSDICGPAFYARAPQHAARLWNAIPKITLDLHALGGRQVASGPITAERLPQSLCEGDKAHLRQRHHLRSQGASVILIQVSAGHDLCCSKISALTERSGTMRPPCIQRSSKPCPICRVWMLGSRTGPTPRELDHFECLNCGLVMDYSRSENTPLWTAKSTNKIRTVIQ